MSLIKSYLGQVKGLKIDPGTVPFEAYIMQALTKQAQIDVRNCLWNGVFDEDGDSPLECFDGLKAQILHAIVDGDIPSGNIVDTAAITNSNAVGEYEKIMAEIDSEYFYGDMVCVTNRKMKRAYELNYRDLFGALPYNKGFDKEILEGSDIEFIVEPNLDGFDRPLFLPKNNIVYLYDDESEMTDLQVDYDKRTRSIAVTGDFQTGVGFGIAELFWTKDA